MALSPSDASCRFPVTSSESPSSQAKDSLPPASPRTTDTPFLRLMQHSCRHMRFCNISPRRHHPGRLPASSARGPIPLRHPQAITQTGAVPVGGSSRSSVCCLCGEGRGGAALAQAAGSQKSPASPSVTPSASRIVLGGPRIEQRTGPSDSPWTTTRPSGGAWHDTRPHRRGPHDEGDIPACHHFPGLPLPGVVSRGETTAEGRGLGQRRIPILSARELPRCRRCCCRRRRNITSLPLLPIARRNPRALVSDRYSLGLELLSETSQVPRRHATQM